MRDLTQQDIIPIIMSYLHQEGYSKVVQKLETQSGISLKQEKNKFTKTPIENICQLYIQEKPKLQKLFQEIEEEPELEINQSSSKQKKKKQTVQQSPIVPRKQSQEVVVKTKKNKKPETPISSRKSSCEQIQKSINKQKITVQKSPVVSRKNSVDQKNQKVQEIEKNNIKRKSSFASQDPQVEKQVKQVQFFSRTDYSRVDQLDHKLLDNTYEAKIKYGHGDDFGSYGNSRLAQVQGKEFKKAKDKMRRKAFQGGDFKINTNQINSIKL